MGYIVYDGEILEFKVEDGLLAHLQIVIVNKFRKNESFMFSWKEPIETGDGVPRCGCHRTLGCGSNSRGVAR
ncbi:hypothetical protein FFA01_23450 [Frigoribacterium faeni]|uniref:DUF7882 domain-containing protein n=1 Tax=Frigoribacterium faeni TaxID=145483 RepID=A0A7W3JKB0_9MICO|nr:hypothetical protein [Frigoribacterium faeni]BFF15833.1 hypothetical protein GCM10025699_71360 [Microbacterium flavescens]GEK84036.1 hypothetical protein FFA01_23450 [Frigoribacterium faeni]